VTDQGQSDALAEKVKNWLSEQGFPLEFRTAAAFQSAGIRVLQGFYVTDQSSGLSREIDILAKISVSAAPYLEIGIVVECKWSRDKPWVVFTSRSTIMAPEACIAQTMGSSLGRAAMHCLASDEGLGRLAIFSCEGRNGFSGRRALVRERDTDHFYAAVQGVVGKALTYAHVFDRRARKPGEMPASGCVTFPMIVVEGDLFEAYYDAEDKSVGVVPADIVRLHWRGAEAKQWISTVDIVRFSALERVIAQRRQEFERLAAAIDATVAKLARCYREQRLDILDIQPAPRGYIGFPPLLVELYEVLNKRTRTDGESVVGDSDVAKS
jgi:hypothetical protein